MVNLSPSPSPVHSTIATQLEAGLAHLRARQSARREPVIVDEPRPSIEDVVTISPAAQAEYLGYSLAMAGEDANPPRGLPFPELVAFFDGVQAAWREQALREFRDRDAFEAFLDTLAEPGDDWPFEERVEAVGVIAARK